MKKLIAGWFSFEGLEQVQQDRILGIVKGTLIALSWLSLILGILFFLIILIFGGGPDAPRVISLLALVIGIIYFIMFYVIAAIVNCIVHIEDNTKKTTLLLGGKES